MFQTIVRYRVIHLSGLIGLSLLAAAGSPGCLKIGGNEPLVRIDRPGPAPAPVDTSHVPPIQTVEEGRQRLAEAYERIDYLQRQLNHERESNGRLKADVKEVKRERDAYKDQLKRLRDD